MPPITLLSPSLIFSPIFAIADAAFAFFAAYFDYFIAASPYDFAAIVVADDAAAADYDYAFFAADAAIDYATPCRYDAFADTLFKERQLMPAIACCCQRAARRCHYYDARLRYARDI